MSIKISKIKIIQFYGLNPIKNFELSLPTYYWNFNIYHSSDDFGNGR